MTSEEDMKRELRERFERLKGNPENPIIRCPLCSTVMEKTPEIAHDIRTGRRMDVYRCPKCGHEKLVLPYSSNPSPLQNCIDVRVTEDENIEIHFKDIPDCAPVRAEYEKVLKTALMGGETIYRTLPKVTRPRTAEEKIRELAEERGLTHGEATERLIMWGEITTEEAKEVRAKHPEWKWEIIE